uniref:Uncharacterized protein n=1 Tax=Anguilla anguilla TaxID=7936 RepID=A0A0E9Q197_ANGAN
MRGIHEERTIPVRSNGMTPLCHHNAVLQGFLSAPSCLLETPPSARTQCHPDYPLAHLTSRRESKSGSSPFSSRSGRSTLT